MSVANKAIVIRHLEETWNQNNVAILDECVSSEAVLYSGSTSVPFGPDQVRARIELWHDAAADFRWHIGDLISEGDKVVARLTFRGTHTGTLRVASRTLPATGKRFSVGEMIVFRLAGGKILEFWTAWDRLSLLEQLDALPSPADHG
jgi:predicted ester cyclase